MHDSRTAVPRRVENRPTRSGISSVTSNPGGEVHERSISVRAPPPPASVRWRARRGRIWHTPSSGSGKTVRRPRDAEHVGHRRVSAGHVEVADEAQRHRQVVYRRAASNWFRNHIRCWASDNGMYAGRGCGQQRGPRAVALVLIRPMRERGHGRRLEDRPHRQSCPSLSRGGPRHGSPSASSHRVRRSCRPRRPGRPEHVREDFCHDRLRPEWTESERPWPRRPEQATPCDPACPTGSTEGIQCDDRSRHHVIGNQPAHRYLQGGGVDDSPATAGITYPTSRSPTSASDRTIATACPTDDCASSAVSTSPSSIRNPRNFTWKSTRPT